MPSRYAIDTNVLLRLYDFQNQHHALITNAIKRLDDNNIEVCFTIQNLREFWNVSTRPLEHNGFDLSIQDVYSRIRSIESKMTLLPDNGQVYSVWIKLLLKYQVRGVQVHDAYLAATLEAHGVTHLLTFNGGDFKRFPSIVPVHPAEVQG